MSRTSVKASGDLYKPSADDTTFGLIEKEFRKILKELKKDDKYEQVGSVLEKVKSVLLNSFENERRLVKKCRELNAELNVNQSKVSAALRLSSEDKATIESLKEELEKSWKLAEQAFKSEQKARHHIHSLEAELKKPEEEEVEGLPPDQKQLAMAKEELTMERDKLLQDLTSINDELQTSLKDLESMRNENSNRSSKIEELQREHLLMKSKADKEMRRRDGAEKELEKLKYESETLEKNLKNLEESDLKNKESLTKVEQLLKEKTRSHEKITKDLTASKKEIEELQAKYSAQEKNLKSVIEQSNLKTAEIEKREDEIKLMKNDIAGLTRDKKNFFDKLQVAVAKCQNQEKENESMKNLYDALEVQIDQAKQQSSTDQKAMLELRKQNQIVQNELQTAHKEIEANVASIKMMHSTEEVQEKQMAKLEEEVSKLANTIVHLEQERDFYVNKIGDMEMKAEKLRQTIKIFEAQNLEKKLTKAQDTIDEQEDIIEEIRIEEREAAAEARDKKEEIDIVNAKLKQLTQKVTFLKEETKNLNVALKRTKDTLELKMKENNDMADELRKTKLMLSETENELRFLEKNKESFCKLLERTDERNRILQKNLGQMSHDRNILGTQLLRRNDELRLLMKRMDIQTDSIMRGEQQYSQRLRDIQMLKREIESLRGEKQLVTKNTISSERLRRQLLHTEKELSNQQHRAAALEEELHNPMNMHRWRELQGSDPEKYELVVKVQSLQKLLTNKTAKLDVVTADLKEKERICEEMKNLMAKKPKKDILNQLQICWQMLEEKNKELKTVTAQMNMYQSYLADYQSEVDRLAKEVQRLQRRNIDSLKKSDTASKQKSATSHDYNIIRWPENRIVKGPKRIFRGGGFRIQ